MRVTDRQQQQKQPRLKLIYGPIGSRTFLFGCQKTVGTQIYWKLILNCQIQHFSPMESREFICADILFLNIFIFTFKNIWMNDYFSMFLSIISSKNCNKFEFMVKRTIQWKWVWKHVKKKLIFTTNRIRLLNRYWINYTNLITV